MSSKPDFTTERRINNAYAAFHAYEDASGCDPELSLHLLLRDLMVFAERERFEDFDSAVQIARGLL